MVDPTAEQMDTAAARRGGLSVEDWLCFMLAQEQGAVCVTNDRRLRAECQADNVTVMRGLEPLVLLVQAKHVHPRVAVAAVRIMHDHNAHYITAEIVEDFIARIES